MVAVTNAPATPQTTSAQPAETVAKPKGAEAYDAPLNNVIAVSATDAATHSKALAGLMVNYDKLPKDKDGYITREGLQKVVDSPKDYPADAVSAARYFLDNKAQFDALDTARQKYEDKKPASDGKISREDIYNEQQHPDVVSQEAPKTQTSGSETLKEKTNSGWHTYGGTTSKGSGYEKQKTDAQQVIDGGINTINHLPKDAVDAALKGDNSKARDRQAKVDASASGSRPAGSMPPPEDTPVTTTSTATTATSEADKASKALAASATAKDAPTEADAKLGMTVLSASESLWHGDHVATIKDLRAVADAKAGKTDDDGTTAVTQAEIDAATAVIRYYDQNGGKKGPNAVFNAGGKDEKFTQTQWVGARDAIGQKTADQATKDATPAAVTAAKSTAEAYKAKPTEATAFAALKASATAASTSPTDSDATFAMTAINGNALFGKDQKASVGDLFKLSRATAGGDTTQAQIDAAKTLIAYYDTHGGKNGPNIVFNAGGHDEKFTQPEWVAAIPKT